MKTYQKQDDTEGLIEVREDFVPYDLKTIDSKNRITLSGKITKALEKKIKVDSFRVFLGNNGDILLRPMTAVPSAEAWLYKNEKALKNVKSGLKDAKNKKTQRVSNLDSFINGL